MKWIQSSGSFCRLWKAKLLNPRLWKAKLLNPGLSWNELRAQVATRCRLSRWNEFRAQVAFVDFANLSLNCSTGSPIASPIASASASPIASAQIYLWTVDLMIWLSTTFNLFSSWLAYWNFFPNLQSFLASQLPDQPRSTCFRRDWRIGTFFRIFKVFWPHSCRINHV